MCLLDSRWRLVRGAVPSPAPQSVLLGDVLAAPDNRLGAESIRAHSSSDGNAVAGGPRPLGSLPCAASEVAHAPALVSGC